MDASLISAPEHMSALGAALGSLKVTSGGEEKKQHRAGLQSGEAVSDVPRSRVCPMALPSCSGSLLTCLPVLQEGSLDWLRFWGCDCLCCGLYMRPSRGRFSLRPL